MKRWLAFDIGCIECGESSRVIGIFKTKAEAEAVAAEADGIQAQNWTGEHSFRVFEVEVPK